MSGFSKLLLILSGFTLLQMGGAAENELPANWTRLTTDGKFKQRPVLSPKGDQFSVSVHEGSRIDLCLVTLSDLKMERVNGSDKPEYDISWDPSGENIAFSRVEQSGTQGDVGVHIFNLENKERQVFANKSGKLSHEEYPSWSPDGKAIAFTSTDSDNQEIYVRKLDSEDWDRITSDAAIDAHPQWSPDGKKIVFATARWGDLEIAVVDLETKIITRLTESPGLDDYPVFSPEGDSIAFTSNRSGNFDLYLMQSDGSSPQNLTKSRSTENFPSFTPDRDLLFVSNWDGGFEVYRLDLPEGN